LKVQLPDRVITADISTKSLRKARATIAELGAENVAIVLQGVLVGASVIGEAGLAVQPKAPKRVEAQWQGRGTATAEWRRGAVGWITLLSEVTVLPLPSRRSDLEEGGAYG
jgi:hypothetical protein